MAKITVAAYPRSGSVWVARLLGDALDRPIVGIGNGGTLAAEGEDRPGEKIIHAHVMPGVGHLRIDLKETDPIVVVRDPRDVAVSVSEFWDWPLTETLYKMFYGPGPVGMPPWEEYIESWLGYAPGVQYEDLHGDTEGELMWLIAILGESSCKPLVEVVERQSFAAKRKEIEKHGGPFGKRAQLKHLRKGQVGEWRERFTEKMKEDTAEKWGSMLERLDYAIL